MGIGISAGERGVCIGQTKSGKSTLGTDLIRRFLLEYPTGRVLIVDSKPRFRATHGLNGWPMRYKRWAKGDTIEGSVAVHSASDLKFAFENTRCVVMQSMMANARPVDGYEEEVFLAADWLFRSSYSDKPSLYYVDEFYDILGGSTLAAVADRRLLRVFRAGRERYMAALVCSQRPRSIPLPTLTEADKYYIFNLEFVDDVKYMQKHGPRLSVQPQNDHSFVFYERLNAGKRSEQLMRLRLEAA